jgi:hypothetical protein
VGLSEEDGATDEGTPEADEEEREEMTSPRAPPVSMIPLPGLSRVRSPEVGWVPGKAGIDSKIFALVPPSKVYPDGKAPLGAHYSDKTDENYIVERVNHRLKLPPLSDGKVVMSWVPEEGGEVISQRFAVWPDEKGLADVVFTTQVGEKGNEPVPKILSFPGMSFSTGPGIPPFFFI